MVERRPHLRSALATAPNLADAVEPPSRASWFATEAERAEARADYEAMGWPPDVIEREIAALGPTAEEAWQLPQPELSPRGLMPLDVPVPPAWRDPGRMATAVEEAVAALRANPKAAQGPRLVIFRAVSRLTDLGRPLTPDILDALALGLGIAGKVRRRSEARKVCSATSRGIVPSAMAADIGRSDRTARRRKDETHLAREWPDAAAVIASVERLATIRESSTAGGWDEAACLTLYDAATWFAERARPIPDAIWWAIALAMGLAVQVDGEARWTDDTVEALWASPTPRPSVVTEAARLYVQAEIAGVRLPSNRKLAGELGVRPAVIDRLVKTRQWATALWSARIWARWNKSSSAPQADLVCLVARADCPRN